MMRAASLPRQRWRALACGRVVGEDGLGEGEGGEERLAEGEAFAGYPKHFVGLAIGDGGPGNEESWVTDAKEN